MKPSTTIKILLLVLLTASITMMRAQTVINNTLTEKHQHIPRSKVSIIPPNAFVPVGFTGYENRAKVASIQFDFIEETYPMALRRPANGYNIKGEKVSILYKETCTVAGFTGTFFVYGDRYLNDTCGYILVFGNETEAVTLEGSFKHGDAATAEEIRKSIFSIVYESGRTVSLYDAFDFTLDTSGTGFKPGSIQARMLVFIPKQDTMAENNVNYLVVMPLSKSAPAMKPEEFANEALQLYTMPKFKAPVKVTVGGVNGYALNGTGKVGPTSIPAYFFAVALQGKTNCMLLGCATTHTHLASIKKLIASFKLKP